MTSAGVLLHGCLERERRCQANKNMALPATKAQWVIPKNSTGNGKSTMHESMYFLYWEWRFSEPAMLLFGCPTPIFVHPGPRCILESYSEDGIGKPWIPRNRIEFLGYLSMFCWVHPQKHRAGTWKYCLWKNECNLQITNFGFYVNFSGCRWCYTMAKSKRPFETCFFSWTVLQSQEDDSVAAKLAARYAAVGDLEINWEEWKSEANVFGLIVKHLWCKAILF